MKQVSAGIIIANENGEVLLGEIHHNVHGNFDLPKGVINEDEAPIEAAIRECYEEFGILFDSDVLLDLGLQPYNKNKDLHLFFCQVMKIDIDMHALSCTSTYTCKKSGNQYPEINSYQWAYCGSLLSYCSPALTAVINEFHHLIRGDHARFVHLQT